MIPTMCSDAVSLRTENNDGISVLSVSSDGTILEFRFAEV